MNDTEDSESLPLINWKRKRVETVHHDDVMDVDQPSKRKRTETNSFMNQEQPSTSRPKEPNSKSQMKSGKKYNLPLLRFVN